MRCAEILVVSTIVLGACDNAGSPSTESLSAQLVGSWDLIEYDRRDESGTIAETYYGDEPLGIITYTESGDMSVHLVDSRVGEFASNDFLRGTPAEIKEAYEGYFGYFGTYTVDEVAQTVTHHVVGASFRGYTGRDMTRNFRLDGDRLSLVSGVEIEAGVPSTFHLVWQRRN